MPVALPMPIAPLGKLPEVSGTVLPEGAIAPGTIVEGGAVSAPVTIDGKPCVDCPPPAPGAAPKAPEVVGPFDFKKLPVITPTPRGGMFVIPPTGPGYYTFVDLLNGNLREKPPKFPFGNQALIATSAFDQDFRYLDDPKNTQHDWSDVYKRVKVGDSWLFSTGGEVRYRYMNEQNSRLSGIDNSYNLLRTRAHIDALYEDKVRVFVEFIDARSSTQSLTPLPIDVNRADLLNAFAEFGMAEIGGSPVELRIGRQELLYGSQRLISTLDWATTRRTFQGVKGFWHSEKLDVDAFWVQPVIPDPKRFDSVDNTRTFYGTWMSYKSKPGSAIDLYYLGLTSTAPATRGDTNTLGFRWVGDEKGQFLYDLEGMYQFGQRGQTNQPISARAATVAAGWRFGDVCWNPIFWAGYDYASGDRNTPTGDFQSFNQLFPFGHYYLGFADLVGRSNIQDLNFQFSVNPMPFVTLLAQYHMFRLDSEVAPLVSAGGATLRSSPTGRAGDHVGQEVDFLASILLSQHQSILLGYSHFDTGDFIGRTSNARTGRNNDLFYAQYGVRW